MPAATTPATGRDLDARAAALGLADSHRLRRRIAGAERIADAGKRGGTLDRIAGDVAAAEERLARRRASVPAVSYPEALPITDRVDDIRAALEAHQVVVVAGETGSGKTTQLPKIALELGRGVLGTIGHTQPRRIAARTVAERVAEELGTTGTDTVGYQVRFTSRASEDTLVKLMTDGILLAEIQQDRLLRRYDTLIIDEAHERSLNIDFLLGYLAQLLPRRPDLKVIITSATIDPERFSRHFGSPDQPAPIIEVSGRTYPVEIRYRPLVDSDGDQRDQVEGIVDAVDELRREGPDGDVLVFLSGEREIRDAADALIEHAAQAHVEDLDVLPLYARLSAAEQHRVFEPARGGRRRVVLATNVAETSLTVPGIRYVVDPGLARISRYSRRTKVQRLPIEPISQASATQRAGRCGRVADGICIRLYAEDDFDARPEFTDPEIQRTNLASVILQMAGAKLGPVEEFPFVDPPERLAVRDGVRLLTELGALVDGDATRLSDVGRRLARLPVDPRIARMVLAADELGCLHEVTVIAAGLSAQDPRERPAEKTAEADAAHARFTDPRSDFLSWVHLWEHVRTGRRELSSNQFRKRCQAEFLNHLRIREWQDLAAQLRQLGDELGLTRNEPGQEMTKELGQRIHQAMLTGLLSQIGLASDAQRSGAGPSGKEPPKDPKTGKPKRRALVEYEGSRGARFAIWPGSTLAKRPPTMVMAAELVETSRLWARTVAGIEPAWVEEAAGELVTRTHSEPRWSKRRGAAVATERVSLFGVPLALDRTIDYARIDREVARDLFVRHALVQGEWNTRHAFVARNRERLEQVAEMERRARRELVVDEETIVAFYDARVPADVVSVRHFDRWWQKASRRDPHLFDLDVDALLAGEAPTAEQYPDTWTSGGLTLPLSYAFEPGADSDGVTVTVPLAVLGQVRAEDLAWQVPGLREEMLTALVRSLPKNLRRSLVPAPDSARAIHARLARDGRPRAEEPLLPALSEAVRRLSGLDVPVDAWNVAGLPSHLRLTFRVTDDEGGSDAERSGAGAERVVAEGPDLGALRRRHAEATRAAVAAVADGAERRGLTSFDEIGELPRTREQQRAGGTVTAHLGLVDTGRAVDVRVFDSAFEARDAMRAGTRRLLRLAIASPARSLVRSLDNRAVLRLRGAMTSGGYRDVDALAEDCVDAAIDALVATGGGPAWDPAAFERLRGHVAARLPAAAAEVLSRAETVLGEAGQVELAVQELAQRPGGLLTDALDDVRGQLRVLVGDRFVARTPVARLPDVARYLRAARRRLEKLPTAPGRDAEATAAAHGVEAAYRAQRTRAAAEPRSFDRDAYDAVAWMLQELRVSLFAQDVGTPGPVSEQRITKALAKLT
ncbi:ATP-dependent RNA helicase HrpA [Actinomycetospora lutea]|uniref:ATP-dependent RNA helicase HrpA n=1 Tax=Actinomycetospora lutea TaxID=663604 RepID=UPI002366E845|nr:ATP-dependent RNA helicase HrpA [Actinomycetospora lutea]MDD7938013.1 ATP-dependent RNA helicase HrpA [Actinomycetospora lutea]